MSVPYECSDFCSPLTSAPHHEGYWSTCREQQQDYLAQSLGNNGATPFLAVWSHCRAENPGGVVALSSAAALSLERADAKTSEPGKVSRSFGDSCRSDALKTWVSMLRWSTLGGGEVAHSLLRRNEYTPPPLAPALAPYAVACNPQKAFAGHQGIARLFAGSLWG